MGYFKGQGISELLCEIRRDLYTTTDQSGNNFPIKFRLIFQTNARPPLLFHFCPPQEPQLHYLHSEGLQPFQSNSQEHHILNSPEWDPERDPPPQPAIARRTGTGGELQDDEGQPVISRTAPCNFPRLSIQN